MKKQIPIVLDSSTFKKIQEITGNNPEKLGIVQKHIIESINDLWKKDSERLYTEQPISLV